MGTPLQQATPLYMSWDATITDKSVLLGQRGVLTSRYPVQVCLQPSPYRAGSGGTCSAGPWPGMACAASPTACGSTCPAAVQASASGFGCGTCTGHCVANVLPQALLAPAPGLPDIVAAPGPIVRLHGRHRLDPGSNQTCFTGTPDRQPLAAALNSILVNPACRR